MSAASTHKRPRWCRLFLIALSQSPDVSKAAEAAGVTRSAAYKYRQRNEDFAIEWADTIAKSLDVLEAALFKRATETDTTAAIFLLKSHRPDIYGDRQRIEHSGAIRTDLRSKTDEELQQLADGLSSKRHAGAA